MLIAYPSHATDVRFGGELWTGFQLGMTGCSSPSTCRLLNFRNTNLLGLSLEATPSRLVELRARVDIRNITFSRIETLDDAGDISKVQPVDVRPRESVIVLYDLFGAKGFDLAGGYQRFSWGTGDGINPTDIVNPYNLENGTGFDRRLPSLALTARYTISDVRIEVAWIPIFSAAILPVDQIDFTALGNTQSIFNLQDLSSDGPPEIRRVETPTTTPDYTAENFQVATRIAYGSPIGDFSLSFYRGFESLPQASGAARLTGFQTQDRIDLGVPLLYPRVMMVGTDWRGPIVDRLSGWYEIAVFFPEAHQVTASETQLQQLVNLGRIDRMPDPLPRQVTQTDDVYVKAVAGLDYFAGDHVYLNLQYARGMPSERQASDIHDYVLFNCRFIFLDGRLNIDAGGTLEIDGDNLGWQATGRIAWLHGDAAELALTAVFLDGQEGTVPTLSKA